MTEHADTTPRLTAAQEDRAVATLLASALGDALGAGYEFERITPDLVPDMIGGGLGNFAPGEWTDDTSQAIAVAQGALAGDLRTDAGLDAVAAGFVRWFADDPADVGIQTRAVLNLTKPHSTASAMRTAATTVHERTGRSAGNGALMRTAPVALAYLHDPAALVEAAAAVARLTHAQDDAGESAALWCLLIRHAILTGEQPTFDDVATWAPRPDVWRARLQEAHDGPPARFAPNGWTVTALQAAWSAIVHTPVPANDPPRHLGNALTTAIRLGHDTDTVAAIAGALLGAQWGTTALPQHWVRMLHGWPGLREHDLRTLALDLVRR